MPPAGFEPTTPAIELRQTCVLDRAATVVGYCKLTVYEYEHRRQKQRGSLVSDLKTSILNASISGLYAA
jgi:hypothetical protein